MSLDAGILMMSERFREKETLTLRLSLTRMGSTNKNHHAEPFDWLRAGSVEGFPEGGGTRPLLL